MSRPFFTARWQHLVLLTFEAPERALHGIVPRSCSLDRWRDRAHVSLVALQMADARVLGLPVPGYRAHPQVNFRTYVRHRGEPAVVFIRQLVPSRLVAAVARWRFGEPFEAACVESRATPGAAGLSAEYRFGRESPRWHVAVDASSETSMPPPESFEHYLKERYLGCRAGRDGGLRTFRVEHPPWPVREVRAVDYEIDFGELYGPAWAPLNEWRPVSVIVAAGSQVAVHGATATDSSNRWPSP